ncbi:MAG: hypothetical protein EBR86_17570 [Planctomycetia bacterium]|nr:hypothetical protein [Planctomycetia bacterium]
MRRLLYHDEARLEYGRRFWADPEKRQRLLEHWLDERHPYHQRFAERWRPIVERVLQANPADDDDLDRDLRAEGLSLRVVVREIPPVFGGFFGPHEATTCRSTSPPSRDSSPPMP